MLNSEMQQRDDPQVGRLQQKLAAVTNVGNGSLEIMCSGSASPHVCCCAVPLAQGRIFDVAGLMLSDCQGTAVLCDVHEAMRWPDGSLKWVRLQWLVAGSQRYRLTLAPKVAGTSRSVATGDTGPPVIQNGLQVVNADQSAISADGVLARLAVTLQDGECLLCCIDDDQLDWDGAITKIRSLRGRFADASGRDRLHWFATVESVPQTATQRWSVTIRNPRAARHPGGIWELGDPNSCLIRSAGLSLALAPAATPSAHDSSAGVRVHARCNHGDSWHPSQNKWHLSQLGSGGANFQSPIHRDRSGTVPVVTRGYQLVDDQGASAGDRATPALVWEGADGRSLGVYVPKFWQNFPRSLTWEGDRVALDVLPQGFGAAHELQAGEQTTIEFWVARGTAEQTKQRLEAVVEPPQERVDPGWIAQTGVIPWLTPRDADSSPEFAKYAALVDQTIRGENSFFAKREQIDHYGWRNFGEVYGDHEAVHSDPANPLVSHYNNQYDVILGLGLHYLRGGDRQWLELMSDMARHVIDIDIYHTDEDWAYYNHGLFWHTVHYVDAGLATHRSYPRGTCGGGPNSGHAYSRGLLLYYCLTGDETAREAVLKMGQWMIDAEDGSRSKYRWLAGGETGAISASGTETYHGPGRGPGNAVEVLLSAYELSQERRYLDQAEHLIRRVVHPDEDIDALDLLDAENKWFYLMFLQALGRYLELKISMNEIDSMYAYAKVTLLRYADWMTEHERPFLAEPAKLEFPTETWPAQDMRKVEVFQWAARHATVPQRERFLERACWFYDHATRELDGFETKRFCRPVAVLLSNGYSHAFFRSGGLERIPQAPPAPPTGFPPQQRFVSQKTRAIANAKRIICGSAIAMIISVVGVTLWWLRS